MPSSVVAAMQYDPSSLVLRVIFVSGSVYEYLDVPESVYLDMKKSGSKGEYLNRYIKKHFAFKKIK